MDHYGNEDVTPDLVRLDKIGVRQKVQAPEIVVSRKFEEDVVGPIAFQQDSFHPLVQAVTGQVKV